MLDWAGLTTGGPGRRNAEVLSVETAGSTAVAELKISPEPFTEGTDKRQHMQWFYFK